MTHPRSELLSALLDGELRGWRRWRVSRHLRRCADCAGEFQRLQQVRELVRTHYAVPVMSDPAEFFWSKLKAEIQRRDTPAVVQLPTPRLRWTDWLWLHQPELAAIAAAIVLLVAGGWLVVARRSATQFVQRDVAPSGAIVPLQPVPSEAVKVTAATTVLPHTVASVVEKSEPQVTVVWISGLPWTADMTEMKTLYGHWDS